MHHPLHDSWKADTWGTFHDNPSRDAQDYLEKKDAAIAEDEAERISLETAFTAACATFRTSEGQAAFAPSDSRFLSLDGQKPALADILFDWIAGGETPLWDAMDVLMAAARGDLTYAHAKAKKTLQDAASWYARTEMKR